MARQMQMLLGKLVRADTSLFVPFATFCENQIHLNFHRRPARASLFDLSLTKLGKQVRVGAGSSLARYFESRAFFAIYVIFCG